MDQSYRPAVNKLRIYQWFPFKNANSGSPREYIFGRLWYSVLHLTSENSNGAQDSSLIAAATYSECRVRVSIRNNTTTIESNHQNIAKPTHSITIRLPWHHVHSWIRWMPNVGCRRVRMACLCYSVQGNHPTFHAGNSPIWSTSTRMLTGLTCTANWPLRGLIPVGCLSCRPTSQ